MRSFPSAKPHIQSTLSLTHHHLPPNINHTQTAASARKTQAKNGQLPSSQSQFRKPNHLLRFQSRNATDLHRVMFYLSEGNAQDLLDRRSAQVPQPRNPAHHLLDARGKRMHQGLRFARIQIGAGRVGIAVQSAGCEARDCHGL